MSFVFNVSKGRVAEYAHRVNTQDPSTSRLVAVILSCFAPEAAVKDCDTLAAVIGLSNCIEVANPGYSRPILDNAQVPAVSPDDTNDWQDADTLDIDFGVVQDDEVTWTHLLICYDAVVGSGTDADIIPLTSHNFSRAPDGSQFIVKVNGFFRAS